MTIRKHFWCQIVNFPDICANVGKNNAFLVKIDPIQIIKSVFIDINESIILETVLQIHCSNKLCIIR